MWRSILSIVSLIVTVVYVGNLLVTGTPSARRGITQIVGIFAAIGLLALWAQSHPEHRLARLLLLERGPGSSGRPWTRRERFRAARLFILAGTIALIVTVVILSVIVSMQPSVAQTIGLYLLPFAMFPAAMGLGGGAYMFIRASLGPRDQ